MSVSTRTHTQRDLHLSTQVLPSHYSINYVCTYEGQARYWYNACVVGWAGQDQLSNARSSKYQITRERWEG